MVKFIIIIGQKCFFNYIPQSSYLNIQTKLLTALFKNNFEIKNIVSFVETYKLLFCGKEQNYKMGNSFT